MTFLHREVFAKAEYFSRVRVLMRQGQAVWYPRTFHSLFHCYSNMDHVLQRKRDSHLRLYFYPSPSLLPTGLLSRFILRYCSYDVYNDRGAEPGGTAVRRLALSPGEACFMIQACRHSFVRQLEMHICKWRKPSAKRGYKAGRSLIDSLCGGWGITEITLE